MKAYKVFRKFRGNLYSAYEGWYSCRYKRIRYNLDGITTDPKPDNYCPGLMVITTLTGAEAFLILCGRPRGTPKTFVLHEVHVEDIGRGEEFPSWHTGYTNSLTIGREIAVRVVK